MYQEQAEPYAWLKCKLHTHNISGKNSGILYSRFIDTALFYEFYVMNMNILWTSTYWLLCDDAQECKCELALRIRSCKNLRNQYIKYSSQLNVILRKGGKVRLFLGVCTFTYRLKEHDQWALEKNCPFFDSPTSLLGIREMSLVGISFAWRNMFRLRVSTTFHSSSL